ncbi:MAG TPA: hypothetical protein VHF51_04245 [Solirubrobacteraceae bacterium]|nr:hypothetical protein [Solirubrobacteraceae bacterium]
MSKEVLAIGLTLLVHIVGLIALIWALVLDPEDRPDWRDWWPGDDDDRPIDPAPKPRGGELPLADAVPSALRLRERTRLSDGYPRPARRPVHAPEPAPERVPEPAERRS